MESIDRQLEQIAVDLTMVEQDDPQALAELHDAFLGLSDAVGDETSTISKAARSCGDLIEKIVIGHIENKESALLILNDAVASLQAVIRDKRELSEVQFPLELGLATDSNAGGDNRANETDSVEAAIENSDVAGTGKPEASSGDIDTERESHIMSFDDNVDTSLMAEFITEARDHCTIAEQMMMDLETGSDHETAIAAIFRGFHTIKGGAGILGIEPLTVIAHGKPGNQ
jgi:hypothetical protein